MAANKVRLKRIQTQDQNLQFVQDNIDTALQALQGVPFGGGSFVQVPKPPAGSGPSALALVTGQDNVFQHNLGYVPTYVLPLAPDAQATIWCTARTPTSITLRCSANCNVAVWVS